jgi:4-amino-4-deoxy-L-arabinose transferase-like glycosyltransferase
MQQIVNKISTTQLVTIILALFLPAHLINLDVAAFNGDEAIRSLVALEMKLSGNYIATTMHGTPYINKPPLFNWILLLSFQLFGYVGEFPARVVTVFFLVVYGMTIYFFVKKEFDRESALLISLMTVLCGRFLIYDSMLGLIDTTFSVVMYTLFMSLYYFGSREKWNWFFLSSYGLMTIGFLLKGMPAIVFQGLSLLAAIWFFGQFKRLLSWHHILSGLLALFILVLYFSMYAKYHSLDILLPNLWQESVKRTGIIFGWWKTIIQLFKFPFDFIYHFLPFSILALVFLNKKFIQSLKANRFAWFNFILFMINIPVYWSSVQVYARYLLMFVPLFTCFSYYLMKKEQEDNSWRYKSFYTLLGILMVLLPIAFSIMPFIPEVNFLDNIWLLSLGFGLLLIVPALFYFYDKKRYMYWIIITLLISRIAFNFIILPSRHHQNITSTARQNILKLVDKYQNRRWYVYGNEYIREPASFYITQKLGYIVHRTEDPCIPNALYIVDPCTRPDLNQLFGGPPVERYKTDAREYIILFYAPNLQ